MDTPKVSVIIPVYNVEKYLENAVNSVLNQTYKNTEIILVDDCSPDNSGKICDELAEKNNNISVIHHSQNKGLSPSRNDGMEIASGEYVFFLDSDDWIDEKTLSDSVASLEKNKAQVVICGVTEDYYNSDGNLYRSSIVNHDEKYLSNSKDIHNELIDLEAKDLYGYSCGKLYDLNFIKKTGVKFKTVTLIEDIVFNIDLFMTVDSCNILNNGYYHYAKRDNNKSLTHKFIPNYYELIMMRIKALYSQYKEWDYLTEKVYLHLALRYSRYLFSALQRNCDKRMKFNHKKRKEFLINEFETELYKDLSPYMGGGGLSGIMAKALEKKQVFVCLSIARIIYSVRMTFPALFEKIK